MGKYVDIIGKRFGKLIILDEYAKKPNNRSIRYVKAVCDCGNIKEIRKEKILRGDTKSCGCIQYEMRHKLGLKNKKQYSEAAFNECYRTYERGAIHRGYLFKLTKEQFKNIIVQPCIYCGNTLTQEMRNRFNNGTFKYTGIDRYDNTKGYTIDNCVPCCNVCNRMKSNLSISEFEKRLITIVNRKQIWRRTA